VKRPLGDIGVEEEMVLKWILKKFCEDMGSSAQNKDQGWVLVNIVMNLQFP
jgi:hypothetical protein